MYKNNRKFNGRFDRKSLNWTVICDTGLFIAIGVWVSYNWIDLTLKAHGM